MARMGLWELGQLEGRGESRGGYSEWEGDDMKRIRGCTAFLIFKANVV